ncbi:hypothetical protein HYALB_00014010 [Hymenoscyphus albidus]|uniref:Uncharacterized protein n=1 Tax=Hymenoscyphus albidus TaxID=595503 RepID=A0A9N9QBE7_9HELO|nr:hypothetical protein HYALB_00014010 [Hymenoscyphus albidus]
MATQTQSNPEWQQEVIEGTAYEPMQLFNEPTLPISPIYPIITLGTPIPQTPSANGQDYLLGGYAPSSPVNHIQRNQNNPSFIDISTPNNSQRIRETQPQAKRQRSNQSLNLTSKYALMSHPETSDDAIIASRSLLCKAIELEDNQPKKLALMDLLNLFRDYTEGKPLKNTITTLTNSVNNLENIARRLPKRSYASVTTNNKPTTDTDTDNSTQGLIDRQLNHAPPQKTNMDKKRDAFKKAATEKKKAIKAQRLILIEDHLQPFSDLHPITLRDTINKEFKARFNVSPAISTVSRSRNNNLVLTAAEEYNAKFLLDRIGAIQKVL